MSELETRLKTLIVSGLHLDGVDPASIDSDAPLFGDHDKLGGLGLDSIDALELGIVLNTINPGPVNTGYLDAETTDRPLDEIEQHLASTPFGRVGRPDDPAALIGWLATQDWIVGQVITSDGGFSLA